MKDYAARALKLIDLQVDIGALGADARAACYQAIEDATKAAVRDDRHATRAALARLEEAVEEQIPVSSPSTWTSSRTDWLRDLAADLRRLREGLA